MFHFKFIQVRCPSQFIQVRLGQVWFGFQNLLTQVSLVVHTVLNTCVHSIWIIQIIRDILGGDGGKTKSHMNFFAS